jgi:hypothetical protein
MPKSKNYKWQKDWNVDHEASTATHDGGIMYKLGTTGVVFMIKDKYADDYAEKMIAQMGIINATEHLGKLKRQAIKLLKGNQRG